MHMHCCLAMNIFNQYLSKEDFIGVGAIDVGGVEEGDTRVDGMMDERDHVFIRLWGTVEGGHSHAP